ncbi:DUF1249 domain-containing protein [Shewanella dokdonensis]|uniref:DUF1249 domain-containing protein n=1 Tax=Shewanella dokdonensis TaxID=712036 RepID=A0ABX8DCP9_9GAMM|nr:DUF1249 domain-containing protein [Shewanella dokdonensis]MCL1074805.1 DUF1249 domain-containing protein [Shewanella dokdonensis]QVK22220.1 DUF1249 domain-containing protein [Shewanella dokdonensis]
MQKIKDKYQPDVSRFLALCGRNYAHIARWLPEDCHTGAKWQVEGNFGCLDVSLLESTPYTQVVSISRPMAGATIVPVPQVTVRVYHDAKLAEVLSSQQISRLQPVYDYPNLHMHHRNEKYQVNAFLEELLKIDCRARLVCQS